jgi:hypothetical protein
LGDSKNEITEFGRYKSNLSRFHFAYLFAIRICDYDLSHSFSVFCLIAKVRRLYDIANVLSTINLITKVTDPSYRGPRPAFQYIGPRTEIIHHAESRILLRE